MYRIRYRGVTMTSSLAVTLLLVIAMAAPAGAQTNSDLFETCSLFNTIVNSGGERAVEAIAELRELGAPNPPGVEDAFDVLSAFEDSTVDDPTTEEIEAANDNLAGVFGPVCAGVDTCVLLDLINGPDPAEAAQGADWLNRISAPSPPGIGAALSVLSGDVEPADTSGLVTDEAEALVTVNDWFGPTCRLAITGPASSTVLAVSGFATIALGFALLALDRSRAPRVSR